jgi:hypothetical protein
MKTRSEGNEMGPDEKVPENAWIWPERKVLPYHYPHPVCFLEDLADFRSLVSGSVTRICDRQRCSAHKKRFLPLGQPSLNMMTYIRFGLEI